MKYYTCLLYLYFFVNKSIMKIFKFTIFLIFFSVIFCGYLTPQHIEQHIKRLIAEKYQLYVINLGNTVTNNPLKAYVISGIKKDQDKISELTSYPATLITSYMHPRQPYSIKLMQKILDQVLNNYSTDYFFKYMLDNTLLILFPFVNIDGYYRYKQLETKTEQKAKLENYRKNMNRYGKCQDQWNYGVDINRNFDAQFATLTTSDHQCGEQYRGPEPFSQKQSKAIKILYKKFKITLAIDIHSYGNQWIYPYASQRDNQKLENHELYPIYQDLQQKFKAINRPMKSCFQSLGYTADGVYIDWALNQGALSLAIQIGTSFDHDSTISTQILFQVEEPFHIILKKNSIAYKSYLTNDRVLMVESTSLIDFHVIVSSLDGISSTKLLKAGKKITFPEYLKEDKVILVIKDTIIKEEIDLKELGTINVNSGKKQNKVKIILKFGFYLTILSAIGYLIWIYLQKIRKQKEVKSFSLPKYDQTTQQIEDQVIVSSNLQPSVLTSN